MHGLFLWDGLVQNGWTHPTKCWVYILYSGSDYENMPNERQRMKNSQCLIHVDKFTSEERWRCSKNQNGEVQAPLGLDQSDSLLRLLVHPWLRQCKSRTQSCRVWGHTFQWGTRLNEDKSKHRWRLLDLCHVFQVSRISYCGLTWV